MATNWTKETALAELHALAEKTQSLTEQRCFAEEHTRWIARTSVFLEEVFGQDSPYYQTFIDFTWRQSGGFVIGGPGDHEARRNPALAIEKRHQRAYLEQLESARGLLLAAADHLARTDLRSVYRGKDTAPESSAIVKVLNLSEHKLRKIIRVQPNSEKEVQDAFENLLVGADIPYSRETESIEYSSKTYTPDFTMSKIDLAIEIKLCNRGPREKEMIAEINDDILAYQTKYGNLLFVVYDLGFIRDVDRFINSFEEHYNVMVRVVKH
jgi:hypothetical protein